VYKRFIEARNQKQLITRRQLQQWAIAAAAQFRNMEEESECAFRFIASPRWSNFLNAYRISNRRVTRYLSKKEIQSPKEIQNSAIQFQNLIQSISADYNSDFIINTDQTNCEYCVNVARTYTHANEKTVELSIEDLNKIHSYTAQYALTQSGILLDKVFVYKNQETNLENMFKLKLINCYNYAKMWLLSASNQVNSLHICMISF